MKTPEQKTPKFLRYIKIPQSYSEIWFVQSEYLPLTLNASSNYQEEDFLSLPSKVSLDTVRRFLLVTKHFFYSY